MNTLVLNDRQINQKLQRIAYEILENNSEDGVLYLVGITGNGLLIAQKLKEILSPITEQIVKVAEVSVNKQEPLSEPIRLSVSNKELQGTLILIDDVINSGRTMQYALMKLLEQPVRKVKTVSLVDRKHRRYPIRCDYVGLTLSTTLQDRVEVVLEEGGSKAYLV
jgi:pyrimidine operon attenuation protein / uracil phosphoribosyltransferase